MRVSVILSGDDVAYLESLEASGRYDSQSAALQQAVRLLRASELGDAYEAAWAEWEGSDDEKCWSASSADALRPSM